MRATIAAHYTSSFIRLRKFSTARGPTVEIKEMGDSGAILTNKAHLRETAREMIRRGLYPQDGGWNGWLGRYQKARLTPHSHSNRRRRKNANGAEAET